MQMFEKACFVLNSIDWDFVLPKDVSNAWLTWQSIVLQIMEECVPRVVLRVRHNLLSAQRKQHNIRSVHQLSIYRQHSRTNSVHTYLMQWSIMLHNTQHRIHTNAHRKINDLVQTATYKLQITHCLLVLQYTHSSYLE